MPKIYISSTYEDLKDCREAVYDALRKVKADAIAMEDYVAKDQRPRGGYYSLEFCGGPHVGQTGIIGGLKIEKEEAVSQGVRRIRAVFTR